MNTPIPVPPNGGGLRQHLLRGTLLKWNEVDGYLDRDGVRPVEGPYLLWGMEDGYQRWKDQTLVDDHRQTVARPRATERSHPEK